ncbi:MAG: hypothetical protein DRP51_10495, partial [Candidatus Zixiibacteriota bacterium]
MAFLLVFIFIGDSICADDEIDSNKRSYFDYHASTEQFLAVVDSAVVLAREELIIILGDSLHYRPQIFIEDNQTDFQNRIGVAVPDWGAAVALPYKQMIVLKSPANFRLGKSLFE